MVLLIRHTEQSYWISLTRSTAPSAYRRRPPGFRELWSKSCCCRPEDQLQPSADDAARTGRGPRQVGSTCGRRQADGKREPRRVARGVSHPVALRPLAGRPWCGPPRRGAARSITCWPLKTGSDRPGRPSFAPSPGAGQPGTELRAKPVSNGRSAVSRSAGVAQQEAGQQEPRSCQTPHSPVVPGSSPVVHHLAFQVCPRCPTCWPAV